jgi:hypothetical protein
VTRSTRTKDLLTFSLAFAIAGCGGAAFEGKLQDENLDFGDEGGPTSSSIADEAQSSQALVADLANGSQAQTTTGLNLRTGPSTDNRIILAMPGGARVTILGRSGSWYSVNYQGTTGWSHGGYLRPASAPSNNNNPPAPASSGVQAAMERARSGVGFSYFWGGGCWDPGSSAAGACYGSCPNCRHEGRFGADCSAYVSKVWQVGGQNNLTTCDHGPLTSGSYYSSRTNWSQVSRSNARQGDAFVRQGHIFIYNSGDAWGSINAFEAKGCSYGIVHNNRTADSSYLVIRRHGY